MEHAPNLLIAALLLTQLVFLGWISAHFKAKIREVEGTIKAFITPKGTDEASPLALVVDVGADMVGRAVCARIKTSLMGQQSGQVRQEKAVEGAIAEDVARAAHPLAGTLLDAMPELKKTLRKNPGLLDFALSKLSSMQVPSQGTQTISTLLTKGGINGQEKV